MKTIKSNKEDLFFCHLGNGVSVCDRLRKENGDYIEVAHISYERAVIYYNSISDESREIIERFALYGNINMSVTQPYPVLNVQTYKIMNTKDLINQIEISGIITRAQLYTIIRCANGGDKDAKSVCFKENTVFADEEIKEIELNKLRKEARKKYSSFGWREKNVLQGSNLKLNLCCFRGSTPVYWVLSDNGSFEYYITREINVVG